MSAIALEPPIAEAKRRARQRRLLALAAVVVAGGAIAGYSISNGGRPSAATPRVSVPAAATGVGCGVRGVGARILSPQGKLLYREPAVPKNAFPAIRCSGATVWAVWFNGVGLGNEAYFGARSSDRGRTWRPVFTERYFGLKAPHSLGSYLGVWTLRGRRDAYFVGEAQPTIALYVTENGGRTFAKYDVPALTGYAVTGIRVRGPDVILRAERFVRGVELPRKTVTIHIA